MFTNSPPIKTPDENVQQPAYRPSRSERMKPVELLVFSGIMALFVGVVIAIATRDVAFGSIAFGITFVIVLVVIALFTLSGTSDQANHTKRTSHKNPDDAPKREDTQKQ